MLKHSLEFLTTHIYFLESLLLNMMKYRGIDSERAKEIDAAFDDEDFAVFDRVRPARDASMANAYATNHKPVFSIVGLAHIRGIQEGLAEQFEKEQVDKNFLFIHLTNSKFNDFILGDFSEDEDETSAALMNTLFPLHVFDGSSQSDDEIIKQILEMIAEKQQTLHAENSGQSATTPLRRVNLFPQKTEKSNFQKLPVMANTL
jgi:hypothetical protein